ncbi:MAG TPA: RluA family pseudouridine synthase [Alphaproteobacteria bacterium]
MPHYHLDLNETYLGKRLDAVLAQLLPLHSRVQIQDWIKAGHLSSVPAVTLTPSLKLKQPLTVTIDAPDIPVFEVTADASIALDILYEDDYMLIINKPTGLAVHPGAGRHDGTLVNALLAHTKGALSDGSEAGRPGIVHRLDKDTSGVMMVAKTNQAHHLLAKALQARDIKRHYQCLVWGMPNPLQGTVDTQIGRDAQNRQRMRVLAEGGKNAITHYNTQKIFRIGEGYTISQVHCQLETGRTHQIRVHMDHIGHAVLGDKSYGHKQTIQLIGKMPQHIRDLIGALPGQALHAFALRLPHPFTGEDLYFEAPPPASYNNLLEAIQKAASS